MDRTKIKHTNQLEIAQNEFGPHEISRYTVLHIFKVVLICKYCCTHAYSVVTNDCTHLCG